MLIMGVITGTSKMRAIALLATYNEERFISGCIEHLYGQGAQIFMMDNSSTDNTVAIAERYVGRGILGIETYPRRDNFNLAAVLRRKEELAATLDADWFMHVDADEIRLASRTAGHTLAEAFTEVEKQGYNAVNFQEFTFVHAVRKYGNRRHNPAALARGWHGWREYVRADSIELPPEKDLSTYRSDDELDARNPRTVHYIAECLEATGP